MADDRLIGRVFVVAGRADVLAAVAETLIAAEGFVAFVSDVRSAPEAQAMFRADPGDPGVWERVAPHVEQRLGPVDAVVTDDAAAGVVAPVFRTDLDRRGHGDVVIVGDGEAAVDVVSRLLDTL